MSKLAKVSDLTKVKKVIVISGASGVGKSTVTRQVRRLKFLEKSIFSVVSFTTRPIRVDEISGFDYHFVSHSKFESLIKENFFLEYDEYAGNYYGTPKKEVEKFLLSDKQILLAEANFVGLSAFQNNFGRESVIGIYLFVSFFLHLKKRRLARGDKLVSRTWGFTNREKRDTFDVKNRLTEYDFIIFNDIFLTTLKRVIIIILMSKVIFLLKQFRKEIK